MRRTGHLEEVPDYLHKSEEAVGTRGALEPGLNFCKVIVMMLIIVMMMIIAIMMIFVIMMITAMIMMILMLTGAARVVLWQP